MKAASGLLLSALLLTLFFFTKTKAQDSVSQTVSVNKQQEVKDLINSRDFIFEVQTVMPLSGSPIISTSESTLTVTPDKIVSRLPYFGRAYVAPVNPDDDGIELNTDSFTYNNEEKKNGWIIQIKPDKQNVQQLTLNVSEDGYANLTVLSSDRQPISYRGVIKKRKERSTTLL